MINSDIFNYSNLEVIHDVNQIEEHDQNQVHPAFEHLQRLYRAEIDGDESLLWKAVQLMQTEIAELLLRSKLVDIDQ